MHGLIPRRHPVTTIPPFIGSVPGYCPVTTIPPFIAEFPQRPAKKTDGIRTTKKDKVETKNDECRRGRMRNKDRTEMKNDE